MLRALVKDVLVMERTQHGPFLSVEDLRRELEAQPKGDGRKSCANPTLSGSREGCPVFDDKNKKRPTPRTTQLRCFVPSAFGNSGLPKDSK